MDLDYFYFGKEVELNISVIMSNMVPKAARPMIFGSDDFEVQVTTRYALAFCRRIVGGVKLYQL